MARFSGIDCHPVNAVGGVEHGLGQRRVGVDCPHQVFDCSFELDRGDRFGDQLGSLRADDVHSQNLAIIGVRNDFDESLMLADDRGAELAVKGNLPTLML